jgi:hypothetical protein
MSGPIYLLFYLSHWADGDLCFFCPLALSDVKHKTIVGGFIIYLLNMKNLRCVWLLRYIFCIKLSVFGHLSVLTEKEKRRKGKHVGFNVLLIELSASRNF